MSNKNPNKVFEKLRSTSDFMYQYGKYSDFLYIWIVDADLGNKSVTNDIENVVNDIIDHEEIEDHSQIMIVYMDSERIWDGWDHLHRQFVPLRADSAISAMNKYIGTKILQSVPNE